MYKLQIAFVFLFILLGTFIQDAGAACEDYSLQYCINDSHKYWERNVCYNETEYNFHETMNCSYGCLSGECLPAPTESHDMAIIIGIMLVAFFFIYAGLKMDKETHGVIQVLFLFVGILFVIINFAVLSEIADYSSISPLESAVDNGYSLAIFVFWFVLFYFIVIFIYKVLVSMGKIQPIKWSM